MNGPLTCEYLDTLKCPCGKRDCDSLHLKALCHPTAGTVVTYSSRNGTLTIRCKKCEKFICEIKVARLNAQTSVKE